MENSPEEFKDITTTCIDCGKDFVFTAGEQSYFKAKNLRQPKRCFACRQRRKIEVNQNPSPTLNDADFKQNYGR